MKKNLFLVALLVIGSLTLAGCGKKNEDVKIENKVNLSIR